jgi:hypothetical protein
MRMCVCVTLCVYACVCMCNAVCVYACVCMCVCATVSVYACVHACAGHACMQVHVHVYVRIGVHDCN